MARSRVLTSNAEGGKEASGHESPVAKSETLLAGVEGQVAVGALGVMVRRGHARTGSVEATLGDQRGGGAGSGAGEHLDNSISLLIGVSVGINWAHTVIMMCGRWTT